MEDYKQYLAQKILTEDQLVTYRLLSRALGVHVNLAKEMLYDFHKWQNDKRPGTLHATYIIYGIKSRPEQPEGDVEMTDSQMSEDVDAPFSDLVPTYTLSLISQEQLEETLSQYTEVASIHVYSLAPHPLKDLQLLTDTARQVLELSIADGAHNSSKVCGTIANPNVRRRERRGGPVPAAHTPPPKPEPNVSAKQEAPPAAVPAIKEEPKASLKPAAASAPSKKPAPAASLKRQGSSGIGQMFAKAAAKPKKPATKASDSAATPAAAGGVEDNQATGALSDDGEDDAEPMAGVKHEDSGARQARKDRQAELRRMMEESDEEEDEEEEESEEAAKSPEEDPMDEEPPPPEPEPEPESKAEEPAEVVASASGGRRRGRRRVTRKKQIMDEKGYLVTIQEPGWESFSEDEAPPPPPKPKQQQQTVKSEPAAKPKKGAAGKAAQGNIMSFFSKK
ncbi:DNA polymerase subunit Cdc27 [Xylaria acuta]|nr:DNA polymerase subunit Cdc27 [Xylaria acuta]